MKPKKHARRKLTKEKVDAINRKVTLIRGEPSSIEEPKPRVVREENKRGRITRYR